MGELGGWGWWWMWEGAVWMIGGFSPLELALFMVAVEEFRLEKLERVASRVFEKVSRRIFLAWA